MFGLATEYWTLMALVWTDGQARLTLIGTKSVPHSTVGHLIERAIVAGEKRKVL